ncbi:MAG: DUF1786 domain-containing protein [Euryarchaeota archaeon]|nr:DUF1786 domain-containing protein [Euryarchaeota archaeon]
MLKGRRILAVDVGTGTQDVLVFDEAREPENCIKMVLPAMTRVLARRLRAAEGDVFITGETMGGGPFSLAVRDHIKKGYRVVMTETAARSIRDNLEEVRAEGVEVVPDGTRLNATAGLETRDVDFALLREVMEAVGEPWDFDSVGVAVQDHGYAEGTSDRVFRFRNFQEAVDSGTRIHELMYPEPPAHFTRMQAVKRTLGREFDCPAYVVDTKVASMAGAVLTQEGCGRPVMAVDIGNGHTTAAILDREDRLVGIYEHHTTCLTKEKLEAHLRAFSEAVLTGEEVLEDGGHGCCTREAVPLDALEGVYVTGPRRRLLEGSLELDPVFPTPYGDVMMTGTSGIVEMMKRVERGDIDQT